MVDTNSVKSINIDFDYKYPFETDEDYQQCFLSVFGIQDFDEKIISEKTTALYNEMKHQPAFLELLRYLAGKFLSDDEEVGLYVLFSFDYLHDFMAILKGKQDISDYLEKLKA